MEGSGLDLSCSGKRLVEGSYESSNESVGYVKAELLVSSEE